MLRNIRKKKQAEQWRKAGILIYIRIITDKPVQIENYEDNKRS